MRRSLTLVIGTASLLFLIATFAGPREYVFRDERVCDKEKVFCLQGTLTYESNPRLLTLRARVRKAPGPGLLRLLLTGANSQGHARYAPFEVRVRGKLSEIINHKMIPDYPDTEYWTVDSVDFVAEDES